MFLPKKDLSSSKKRIVTSLQFVLQFTHQLTHLSPSGLREPLFVGLGQKYGLEGRR
jgi:hypothetical protein